MGSGAESVEQNCATVMKVPLDILHLEDNPEDAELIQEILEADGIVSHITRVETQADFLTALEQGRFDLILADYSLPSFDGLSALKLALEKSPDVPFIFVSATLGEEVAIEALKRGATDYVLKDRLSRIIPSVQRALREAEERKQRKRAQEELRDAQLQLAHVTRVATLGELTASIAHEIIQRIRSFAKKAPPQKDWIDINQTISEVIALARSELQRNNIALETRLSDH